MSSLLTMRPDAPNLVPSNAPIGRQIYPLPGSCERSLEHQRRAHEVIPGGAHTYAKGDDQFPEHLAPVVVRGQGCHVWDLDGNRYIELGSGLRSITLGHGYRPVCDAAYRASLGGCNFARPAKLELDVAEAMLAQIPGAEMIKFAKNGSDATTAAVKIARAATGRDLVALCVDQPFFSTDDWFICTTPMDAGITDATRRETLTFPFNDLPALERIFEAHGNRIACLIMEAERDVEPEPGYLAGVRELCTRHAVVLVFDEIVAGMRLHVGGGQALHGVRPDLSTWGKAMANGFAIAALAGRADLMELGGIRPAPHDRVFLLSTTNGAESPALAACLETLRAYRSRDVIASLRRVGTRLRDGFNAITAELGIDDYLFATGHPANLVFVTKDADHQKSQEFRTLFLQELLRRGVLAPSLVVNDAIAEKDLEHLFWAVREAGSVYARALENGVDSHLVGRPVKPVFRRRV